VNSVLVTGCGLTLNAIMSVCEQCTGDWVWFDAKCE